MHIALRCIRLALRYVAPDYVCTAPGFRSDLRAMNGRAQPCWQETAISAAAGEQPPGLSIRAENVLKELAVELTGEIPPKGRWVPSGELLQKLTFRHLLTARN